MENSLYVILIHAIAIMRHMDASNIKQWGCFSSVQTGKLQAQS